LVAFIERTDDTTKKEQSVVRLDRLELFGVFFGPRNLKHFQSIPLFLQAQSCGENKSLLSGGAIALYHLKAPPSFG